MKIQSSFALGVVTLALACSAPPTGGSGGGLGGGSASGGSGGGGGGGGTAGARGAFPTDPASGHTYSPSIAIDGAGRIHVAMVSSPGTVSYSTCASNCGAAASWSTVAVGPTGFLGLTRTQLQVDAAGHPRILFLFTTGGGADEYRYAACDTACSTASSWSVVAAAKATGSGQDEEIRSFALDAQGHPGFVRVETGGGTRGLYYERCVAASCTSAASWTETLVGADDATSDYNGFTMAYDAAGAVHLALRAPTMPSGSAIYYLRCASGCNVDTNWTNTALYPGGISGDVQLRVDSSNRPRLAYYSDFSTASASQVVYASCNTACADVANWSAFTVGIPAQNGKLAMDLALDPAGHPRIVYDRLDTPVGVGLAACDTGCEAVGSTWSLSEPESMLQLEAAAPVAVATGCSTSLWMKGQEERLAVGPAGEIRIAYAAVHQQGGTCAINIDGQRVRVLSP